MRILVIGKNGQLGRSIQKVVGKKSKNKIDNEFIFVDREDLDLSSDFSINNYFNRQKKFNILVNCAAYTAVDLAENENKLANQINNLAVKKIAEIAYKQRAKLIHISTDYVFNGKSDRPYTETDKTSPINIYGKTKSYGEKAIQKIMPNSAVIIRTSWLYSEFGSNFVKTIINLCADKKEVSVVCDQIGTPTYANDLAKSIINIIESNYFCGKNVQTQTFHYCNDGECSWYDFARTAISIRGDKCRVVPIEGKEWKSKVNRPQYTALNNNKFKYIFDIDVPNWEESLRVCLSNIELI